MIKKILAIILCVITLSCLFTGCENGCGIGLRLYENEYYIYTVGYDSGNIFILGLTDKGREQEYLVVPREIEGKTVKALGAGEYAVKKIKEKYGNENYARFNSVKLKKVFIPTDITYRYSVIGECPVLDGFVIIPNAEISSLKELSGELSIIGGNLYASEIMFAGYLYTTKANVTYSYNYLETINNNYYWIDNYNYGERIEYIPKNPTRDGYEFGGWYKESECINKWNFECDTLPQAQYDEQENEIYQETKLYAKWINN